MITVAANRDDVHLFDTSRGELLAILTDREPGWINGIRFSRDGGRLAVLSEREVQDWDLRQIRRQLREMALDWAPQTRPRAGPLKITVELVSSVPAPPSIAAEPA